MRVVAREPGRRLRDHAHADGMGVAPGQQAGTRRRAHGRDVIVGVLQALLGQPVEGRRTRRPAERTHVAVANVVADDDQHIGCALRRSQRLGKIGRRVREGHIDLAPEGRVGRRQNRSLLVRSIPHAISLSLKDRPVSAVRHHDLPHGPPPAHRHRIWAGLPNRRGQSRRPTRFGHHPDRVITAPMARDPRTDSNPATGRPRPLSGPPVLARRPQIPTMQALTPTDVARAPLAPHSTTCF